MGIGKGGAFVIAEGGDCKETKQNYDRLRQQMGITILTAAVQIDMMRAWLRLSGTKAQDTAVSEIHDCNTKTSLDMGFSYMDEEKRSVQNANAKNAKNAKCNAKKNQQEVYILEMRILGDTPYRGCHSLQLCQPRRFGCSLGSKRRGCGAHWTCRYNCCSPASCGLIDEKERGDNAKEGGRVTEM